MPDAACRDEIHWPPEFHPANVEVRARNEVLIHASPEIVWARLVRASDWPDWYPNSRDVRLPPGKSDLEDGMRFRWKTFGLDLISEVVEFLPYERLAWNARGLGTWVYHAWLLQPVDGGSCRVLTEENLTRSWIQFQVDPRYLDFPARAEVRARKRRREPLCLAARPFLAAERAYWTRTGAHWTLRRGCSPMQS